MEFNETARTSTAIFGGTQPLRESTDMPRPRLAPLLGPKLREERRLGSDLRCEAVLEALTRTSSRPHKKRRDDRGVPIDFARWYFMRDADAEGRSRDDGWPIDGPHLRRKVSLARDLPPLYRRKLLRLFGPFMDASGMAFLEKQVAEISEWRALKSFLPMRWFHSQDEITDALSKVARKHDERGGDWEWAATVALAATVEDDDLLCLPEGGPNPR
jgi:hypothetical protein